MNWKTWLPLALALALGLVSVKVGNDLVQRGKRADGTAGRFAKVIMAQQDLAAGQLLSAEDLGLTELPVDQLPRGAFKSTAELAGRVVAVPVVQGQPLLESLLAPTGAGAGLQAIVPAGRRAVSIEVNEVSGVGGLLIPGCRVDVVCTLHDPVTGQPVVRTIVENASVSAVGQRMDAKAAESREKTAPTRSVTLIVAHREAEAIELAANAGRTRLVLRGSLDTAPTGSEGLTVAELVGSPNDRTPPSVAVVPVVAPPVVAAPPVRQVKSPQRHAVQVIRAGSTSSVQLPLRHEEAGMFPAASVD